MKRKLTAAEVEMLESAITHHIRSNAGTARDGMIVVGRLGTPFAALLIYDEQAFEITSMALNLLRVVCEHTGGEVGTPTLSFHEPKKGDEDDGLSRN